jgi:hypothetical protein
VEHKYKVYWFDSDMDPVRTGSPTEVQFANHSGLGLGVPEPRFIAIHTAIAHVLHLSGAGKVLDNILDEFFDPDAMQVPLKRRGYDDRSLKMSLMELAGNRHQFKADGVYGS